MSDSPYVPFSRDTHVRLLDPIKAARNHAADQYLVPVTAMELPQLSSVYPLMLVKDRGTGQFRMVAMMSFDPGTNLFHQTGLWEMGFAPLKIRSYPFALNINGQNGTAKLFIDERCAALNAPAGSPLFDEDGKEGDTLKEIKPLLKQLAQFEMDSVKFIDTLKEYNLLCELIVGVRFSDYTSNNMAGFYSIDYDNFSKLDAEKVAVLQQLNYLHAIYSMVNSVSQLQILKHRHNTVSERKITEVLVTRA